MANLWSTKNKRIYASVAMLVSAWHVISMSGLIPDVPDFMTSMYGGINILTVAGVYTAFAAYQLFTEEI